MLRRVGTLPFLVEHRDGHTTLAVEGEIDAANTDAFEAILDVVTKADTDTVVVDLTDLEFMDVRGIHAMARSRARIESLGRTFVLRHPPPSLRRILEVLGRDMALARGLSTAAVESAGGQRPAGPETPPPRRDGPSPAESVDTVIEVGGTTGEGWERAVAAVVAEASRTLRELRNAEVCRLDVRIETGSVVSYQARVTISFKDGVHAG